jgi:hypothetical protein
MTGVKVASLANRRSKQEIELFELILSIHPETLPNHKIVNGWDADIYIPTLKVAIMWNGPWHYKDMGIKKVSLDQIKNRDIIKLKEFTNLGIYTFIFEDRYFNPASAFNTFKQWVDRVGFEPTVDNKVTRL